MRLKDRVAIVTGGGSGMGGMPLKHTALTEKAIMFMAEQHSH